MLFEISVQGCFIWPWRRNLPDGIQLSRKRRTASRRRVPSEMWEFKLSPGVEGRWMLEQVLRSKHISFDQLWCCCGLKVLGEERHSDTVQPASDSSAATLQLQPVMGTTCCRKLKAAASLLLFNPPNDAGPEVRLFFCCMLGSW